MNVPRETVAIVLGCPTGPVDAPLPLALARIDAAARLIHQRAAQRVLVLGGNAGTLGTAESTVMREWLTQRGVPMAMIQTETQSRTTYENAEAARRLLPHGTKALLITQWFHAPRALMYFRWCELRPRFVAARAPVPLRRVGVLLVREAMSWLLVPLQAIQHFGRKR